MSPCYQLCAVWPSMYPAWTVTLLLGDSMGHAYLYLLLLRVWMYVFSHAHRYTYMHKHRCLHNYTVDANTHTTELMYSPSHTYTNIYPYVHKHPSTHTQNAHTHTSLYPSPFLRSGLWVAFVKRRKAFSLPSERQPFIFRCVPSLTPHSPRALSCLHGAITCPPVGPLA